MIDKRWSEIARRAVAGLGVQPGELVQVQEHAGRPEVLQEMLLAVEAAGATPWPEIGPPAYMRRLLRETPAALLAGWDRHRVPLLERVDRVLVLTGGGLSFRGIPAEARAAWTAALARQTVAEEARRLPFLLLAVPTRARARILGRSLGALEAALLPALAVPAAALRATIARVLAVAVGGTRLTIRTGEAHALVLRLAARPWLSDDGAIDAGDRAQGSIVSNLPAGSVYTTVAEDATAGTLALPVAGPAHDAVLHFADGRLVRIEAARGATALGVWLDSHSGEPRRVSHLGIGLNPHLAGPLGWTLVDEHVPGALFLALGENRYMGGANESSLNVNFAIPGASLLVDGQPLVKAGRLGV